MVAFSHCLTYNESAICAEETERQAAWRIIWKVLRGISVRKAEVMMAKERNSNIELLRIIAMAGVIFLHYFNAGMGRISLPMPFLEEKRNYGRLF